MNEHGGHLGHVTLPFILTFFPTSQGGSTRNLALTDQAVSEKMFENQRTNGPVNAHLISWPSKAQNIHNLENIW